MDPLFNEYSIHVTIRYVDQIQYPSLIFCKRQAFDKSEEVVHILYLTHVLLKANEKQWYMDNGYT